MSSADYTKVIAGHGSPWPFLRNGSRDETVITHSRAILAWVRSQP